MSPGKFAGLSEHFPRSPCRVQCSTLSSCESMNRIQSQDLMKVDFNTKWLTKPKASVG